jgi:putative hydrolase of the HAD superfamily
MKFYLFDFADVISCPQDMNSFYEMAKLLKMGNKEFHDAYWKHRKPYDKGQKGDEYWATVAGQNLEPKLLELLISWDCKSWGNMNPLTLHLLEKLKHEGKTLGLLSNLPIDLVYYLRNNYSFLQFFDHVFFSAEIKLAKPDREIYEHVLLKTGYSAREIIFFDDREENLKTAKELGLNTFLVTQENLKTILN